MTLAPITLFTARAVSALRARHAAYYPGHPAPTVARTEHGWVVWVALPPGLRAADVQRLYNAPAGHPRSRAMNPAMSAGHETMNQTKENR